MIDVERELRDLRRTLAHLLSAIDATAMPSRTSVRRVQVAAGGAEPTELMPARPDRIRMRVQVASGGPVEIGESPQVVVKGGWRLILDGPPFVDDPPAPSKGAWYATSAILSVVVVTETIRSTQPD